MWIRRKTWDALLRRIAALEERAREDKAMLYDYEIPPSVVSAPWPSGDYALRPTEMILPGLATKVDALLHHLGLTVKVEPATKKVLVTTDV